MSYNTKHIIEQPRPVRRILILLLAVGIASSTQWWFYNQKQVEFKSEIALLSQKLASLSTENQRLKQQSPKHRSDLAIEKATNQQLSLKLDELQEKVTAQNKELLFFQSITQGSTSSKLQFRELDLRADDSKPNAIRYRLVITQGKKINKPITGDINIMLNSEANGTLTQQALGIEKLNLRHVQVIEGYIELKQGTKPKTVSIDLIQNNKITLSKTFDWKLNNKQ